MVHLPSSMLMDLQMARARGSFAVPENTFTVSKQNGCCRLKRKTRRTWRMSRFIIVTTTLPLASGNCGSIPIGNGARVCDPQQRDMQVTRPFLNLHSARKDTGDIQMNVFNRVIVSDGP